MCQLIDEPLDILTPTLTPQHFVCNLPFYTQMEPISKKHFVFYRALERTVTVTLATQ